MPAGLAAIFTPVVLATATLGVAAGVGGYAFIYAKGYSYLTNNPAACANCHVMQDYYDAWRQSPHHATAVCNDCHTPAGTVSKYAVKVENGFHHSMAFTLGGYPDRITARPASRAVVNGQCKNCHAEITHDMTDFSQDEGLDCVRCHASVGHLR